MCVVERMYVTKIPLQHLALPRDVQHAGWLRDRVDIDRRDVDHTSTRVPFEEIAVREPRRRRSKLKLLDDVVCLGSVSGGEHLLGRRAGVITSHTM